MRIGADGVHLTYCSNIHPGESWADVRANIERFFPAVRDRVAPGKPFGVGLRLSARAARELGTGNALADIEPYPRCSVSPCLEVLEALRFGRHFPTPLNK